MLTVHLVRHGESLCNIRGVLCGGGCDAPLTERGTATARALMLRYGAEPCCAIFASPQQRALHTARPLADACRVGISVDERLREIAYGDWDGQARDALPTEPLLAFGRGAAAPPNGETLVEVAARAADLFSEVRTRFPVGTAWLFSHHTTLRLLLCGLLGMDPTRYRSLALAPGSVSALRCDGGSVALMGYGLTDHLAGQSR